ncbi:capsule assembly Wzi family protein [Idiomarina seosinensis]|uniref:capsule assembly Wzi family protein n=1 Tax=Idiomarina seosinensis TaxID=281739 RepID=UPI0038516E7B
MRQPPFAAPLLALLLALASFALPAKASVYISSDNLDLRNSLNLLVNAGHISIPLQQYPMPWRSILMDLNTIDSSNLNNAEQLALLHVRHYLRNAQSGPQTWVQAQVNTDPPRLSRFGRSVHEQGKISVARHIKGERFAARLQLNQRWQPLEDDNEQTLDGSYLAYNLGDFSVSLDALPLWWGPAQHSSLLMSNNARPLNKLRLDYSSNWPAAGFNPLHLSAFIGYNETKLQDISVSREMLGLRAALQVNGGIDAGLSVVHQASADEQGNHIPDNTMLSLDLRKGWQWQQQQFALYAELGFDGQLEDGENPAFTVGGEWHFNAVLWGEQPTRHTLAAEYTDTESTNFYQRSARLGEQPFYQHYRQNIGSGFAPDSRTLSLSYRMFQADGSGWTVQLGRSTRLSGDDQSQALLQRTQPLWGGLLEVGFDYQDSSADELGARLNWQWRF